MRAVNVSPFPSDTDRTRAASMRAERRERAQNGRASRMHPVAKVDWRGIGAIENRQSITCSVRACHGVGRAAVAPGDRGTSKRSQDSDHQGNRAPMRSGRIKKPKSEDSARSDTTGHEPTSTHDEEVESSSRRAHFRQGSNVVSDAGTKCHSHLCDFSKLFQEVPRGKTKGVGSFAQSPVPAHAPNREASQP